jgi:hypothetical protein
LLPQGATGFAHVVAGLTSATRGESFELEPIPRRCQPGDARSLVRFEVSANVVRSGVVRARAARLVAPPREALAAIEAQVAAAHAAVAQCHARWLSADCNHAARITVSFESGSGGPLAPEGALSASGVSGAGGDAAFDCVRDAIPALRLPDNLRPPRGSAFGVSVTVALSAAP